MSKVQPLERSGLGVASHVRIKQPRLPATVWQITEFAAPTSFSWRSSRRGVITTAGHVVHVGPSGTVSVTLRIDQRGPLARVVGFFTFGLTRRYLAMEAQGLKRRCEPIPPSPPPAG